VFELLLFFLFFVSLRVFVGVFLRVYCMNAGDGRAPVTDRPVYWHSVTCLPASLLAQCDMSAGQSTQTLFTQAKGKQPVSQSSGLIKPQNKLRSIPTTEEL
jgi:hypothetical protein